MLYNSVYSMSFMSDNLTKSKYDEIVKLGMGIRNLKNIVSKEVIQNLDYYLNISKFNFIKEMRAKYGEMNSNFDSHIFVDVYTAYQNKFEAIIYKIKFYNIKYKGIEHYKTNTKYHKKGDFNKVNNEISETKLSLTMSFLGRYGHENIVDYIQEQLKTEKDKKKIKLYNTTLGHIEKFGLDRLLKLALSKRYQVINKYTQPIEFKELTFRGRSRKKEILGYNKNFNSEINAFMELSWLSGQGSTMTIPVKYSKSYHGDMDSYIKENPDYEYTIKVVDNDRVKVIIPIKRQRYLPENKTNYLGIDVNAKHNMFALSTGDTFDYDRVLLGDLYTIQKKIDKLKENKNYKVGKRLLNKHDKIKHKILKHNEFTCVKVCKYMNNNNLDHIVMEDLQKGFGKTSIKNEEGINYNRMISALNICDLKNMMAHIASNYDICISTVHSAYTSKACSKCGCISDDNRLDQEHFKCVECGNELNADLNAAINIKNRVVETVFRKHLLQKNKIDNGTYKPKITHRHKVKDVLLSLRKYPSYDG